MERFCWIGILIVIGVVWSGCSEESESGNERERDVIGDEGAEPSTGPGGMILADGYQHVFTGDSTSNSGHISKSPTPTIVYAIGAHTGNFVHEISGDQGLTPETREVGDRKILIGRQEGMLFITVISEEAGEDSKDYPANFQGPVSEEEADEVIDMVMTYNP